MKTYSNYIITRPWLKYSVKYDYEKIMGYNTNYGNPLDSPLITDLIYSIDILSNRIRKTTSKYSKSRYIDVLFEMQGDLNFYLRTPRQRYLDDLLYIDREPNKWKESKSKFKYCISDLENLSRKAVVTFLDIIDNLKEDYTAEINEYDESILYELFNIGYMTLIENQRILVNPDILQNGLKYQYMAELLWNKHVKKEIKNNLLVSRNLRVYGMEKVPLIKEQEKDFISEELII